MEFTCEQIGMDQAELQERVVQGLVDRILGVNKDRGASYDEDGDFCPHGTVMKEAQELVKAAIQEAVERIGEEHIFPMAEKLITDHVFQETTSWGEKRGEPRSFVEYLEERANEYFVEQVDAKGRAHKGLDNYAQRDWKAAGSRVAVMIDQCLASQMKGAFDDAIKNVNMTLAEGLADTARITLAKIAKAVKISVKTK